MEVNKYRHLFVDSSGDRQQRQSQSAPERGGFRNKLHDQVDSFEAFLANRRIAAANIGDTRVYADQMQAQKKALLDEYATTLARLSHDFSRQLGDSGLHLNTLIDNSSDSNALSQLLLPLDPASRQQADQFILEHQVQMNSLRLKNEEIQNFPRTLESWLIQQHITLDNGNTLQSQPAANTAVHSLPQDDSSRYQQISERYRQYVNQIKTEDVQAHNDLLMEAQRSLTLDDVTLAELVERLEQPDKQQTVTDNRLTQLDRWLAAQPTLVERVIHSRRRSHEIPDMAAWARQNGLKHPWLHS